MGDRLFGDGSTLPTVRQVPLGGLFTHSMGDQYITGTSQSQPVPDGRQVNPTVAPVADGRQAAAPPQTVPERQTGLATMPQIDFNGWKPNLGTMGLDTTVRSTPRFDTTGHDTAVRTQDAPGGSLPEVENGTLKIKFGDKNVNNYLAQNNYSTIKIDTPQGVEVREWIDANGGFYFWFRNSSDGKSPDNEKYFIPQSAKMLCINNENFNAEALRLKAVENVANSDRQAMLARDQQAGKFNYTAEVASKKPVFENIDRGMAVDPNQVAKYADRMGSVGSGTTTAEQKLLEESVANSQNPYFRIYLSDVYYAQAMKPVIDQFKAYGRYDVSANTIARIDRAIETLKTVTNDSQQALRQINKAPQGNVSYKLDPYEIFVNPQSGYYGFWTGSYDQANQRVNMLRTTRTFLTTGAFNSVLQKLELLPPTVQPRS